jgi:hypothetical protein
VDAVDISFKYVVVSVFQVGVKVMVYCTQCGAENEEGASTCINCGVPLQASRAGNRGWEEELEVRAEEFGERAEQFGKRMERECFGLPDGNMIIGVLFGFAIILVGARELFGWNIDFGPFIAIVVGVLIIAGVLYNQSKGRR